MVQQQQQQQEEIISIRKGPWTEQEDVQLVFYVKLFGDRRWDFVAKVSGLKRSGKSCRLRWVNYLHPGLKREKMTPHEERLVLELHVKWGNRWSRIARKLPGRTDNEIKNYWRTHMRKKTQDERKRSASCVPSSSSDTSSYSPSSLTSNDPTMDSMPTTETTDREQESFYDTGGGIEVLAAASPWGKINNYDHHQQDDDQDQKGCCYSMDDLWEDIDMSQMKTFCDQYGYYGHETVASPIWNNYCPQPHHQDILQLWTMEADEESKMSLPALTDQVFASYEYPAPARWSSF